MADAPRISADLLRRLPRTFGPALHDQLRRWDLLFPAEQRQISGQLDWLAHLPPDRFDTLFARLLAIESRMTLPRWDSANQGFTVRDAGILARDPLYPQWRSEVENVFSRIETQVSRPAAFDRLPRLLVCVLPPGNAWNDQAAWPDLGRAAEEISLDAPFDRILPGFADAVACRPAAPVLEDIERTWVFACDERLSGLPGVALLTWDGLSALRREFLARLNTVARDLRAVDATNEALGRADIGRLVAPAIASNSRIREFVRTLFLSGNGSLVFCNSFVQWGASEALRRAEPQALVAVFGVRPKLKPFSSAVLFEDQTRSNPVPDEDDPAGSAIDAAMLARYTYLAAQRVSCYRERTLTLMAASGANRVRVLAPRMPVFPKPAVSAAEFTEFALRWLAAEA